MYVWIPTGSPYLVFDHGNYYAYYVHSEGYVGGWNATDSCGIKNTILLVYYNDEVRKKNPSSGYFIRVYGGTHYDTSRSSTVDCVH